MQARGLFSGEVCRLTMKPAPAGTGIVWIRNEPTAAEIATEIGNLAKRARRTSLMNGRASVETVEHVLSAAAGLGVDNLYIELTADETPSTDGSALPFVQAIQNAGIEELPEQKNPLVITEPITINEADGMIAALPGPDDRLDIMFDLDYSSVSSSIGLRLADRPGPDVPAQGRGR